MTGFTHLEDQIRECYGRVAYTHKTHEKMSDRCRRTLAPRIGRDLVEAAVARRRGVHRPSLNFASRANRAMRRVLDAPHRRPATWPTFREGSVEILVAMAMRDGFRPDVFRDGEPIARGSELRFDAGPT